jgi:hypothetical protein
MPKMHFAVVAVVFLGVFGPFGIVHAEPLRVGGLTCVSSPRVGLIKASRQMLRCVFRSNDPARHLVFSGSTRRLDFDSGIARGGALFFAVFASNTRISRRALRGNYEAAGGGLVPSLGLEANVLIGGSQRTIFLRPSAEDQIGVNLAAGVSNLAIR